jgi:cyclase
LKHKVRLIARLDIKAPNLIKGVNLEGVRVVGDPNVQARKYYAGGIDEIIYIDAVATLYARNSLSDLVRTTASDVFIPMTVGGGLRTIQDVDAMMRSGADKVSINTSAIHRPEIITEVARRYGSQAMVLSVEAKRLRGQDKWEAYVDNGREKTGRDVVEWIKEAVERGAGEILLTSVDHEGMARGFDIPLCQAVTGVVDVPVILSGGMGEPDHALAAIEQGNADAIAMAHVLHYNKLTIDEIRRHLIAHGIEVCRHDEATESTEIPDGAH